MQADAEHQQDHADFGQFIGEAGIGDEARRVRPDQDAGDEVTDQRRDAEAIGNCAEDESQPQTGDDGGDKRRVMRHCLWSAFQNYDVGYAPPEAAALQYGGPDGREATRKCHGSTTRVAEGGSPRAGNGCC